MDSYTAHVDIKTLMHEKEFIEEEVNKLERMVEMIEAAQNRASFLEGRQFDIADTEIKQLIDKIEASRIHLKTLSSDLDKIIEDVQKYVDSKYGE